MVKRVLFDFDGVIHSYTSGWHGAENIPDLPVEGIKELFDDLHKEGYEIVVFSTRAETEAGKMAIFNYLQKHEIDFDSITSQKLPAIVCIDDRAICFTGNTDGLLDKIINFQPWNKKV